MKKTVWAILGSVLLGMSVAGAADDSTMGKDKMMMDSNSDGKISKDEYMAYQEKMWMSMKKDSNGMVDAKMMMSHDGMMRDKGMTHDKSSSDKMNR